MTTPIPHYVEKVLDLLEGIQDTGSSSWLACCPVAGHGNDGEDEHPSLRINLGPDGKIWISCRVGCPTEDVLSALSLTYKDLFPPASESIPPGERELPALPDEKDLDLFHEVYSFFLSSLTLEPRHREALQTRGLTNEYIDTRLFRSLRNTTRLGEALRRLHERFASDLYRVPGFLPAEFGPSLVHDYSGLLVAIHDLDNRIVALKTRRDSGHPKYVQWVSPDLSGWSPAHCAFDRGLLDSGLDLVRITEGELKADVCYLQTDIATLGIPGVTNWSKTFPLIHKMGARNVLVAFDWPDILTKHGPRTQLIQFLEALQELSYTIGIETWDDLSKKGLDDLLVAGGVPLQMWGPSALSYLKSLGSPESPPAILPLEESEDSISRLEFPVGVFPRPVRDFVQELSSALPCPPDFVGVAVLAAASAALGTSRKLKVKNSYEEFGNLFLAIIGPPGTLKSPSIGTTIKPLHKIDVELWNQYEDRLSEWRDQMVTYKRERATYDSLIKTLSRDLALGKVKPDDIDWPTEPDHPGPEPKPESVRIEDATMESMHDVFEYSPRGLIGHYDELIAMFRDMNKYRGGAGSDRQFFLKCWQCGSHKVNRKGSVKLLENTFLTIVGGIQPGLITDMRDDRGREDGFFSRFLMTMPECDPNPPLDFHRDLNKEVYSKWDRIVRRIRAIPPGVETVVLPSGKEITRPTHRLVELDPEAHTLFTEWHEANIKESECPGFPKVLEHNWSKMKAYCFRLALVIHYLRWAGSEGVNPLVVDAESMHRSTLLCEYFKSHVKYVNHRMGDDPRKQDIEEFLEYVRSKGGSVVVRDLYRKTRRWGITGVESAIKFLKLVEDRGHGRFEGEISRNGHIKKVFVIS